ncbi:MAG: hypothetical protein RLZ76_65 [Bacteroidota bacterium]|jgi:AraC-like DNA-binding protein
MIVYTFCLFVIIACIILFYNGKANKNAFLLSAYLIIFGIYPLTYHFAFYSENDFILAIIFYNFSPLYFLAGPLVYFYVQGTLKDKIEWKPIHLLHLIPAFVFTVNAMPYLLSSFNHKLEFAQQIHQNVNNLKTLQYNWFIPNITGLIARPISVSLYITASFIELYKVNKSTVQKTRQLNIITRWLISLLTISLFFMIIYGFAGILANQNDIQTTFGILQRINSLIGGLFLIIPLIIVMFPQILYGLPVRDLSKAMPVTKEPYNTKKYIQSTVKNQEAFKILSQKILEYFEAEKPYLKQNFTLTELAAALHCPQHHISYCFSDFLDTTFTKLRSTKRIEYAQNLLREGTTKDFTIDQIAEMSGFSSRSTFFSTFKEITGMTPTEFMEQSKSS